MAFCKPPAALDQGRRSIRRRSAPRSCLQDHTDSSRHGGGLHAGRAITAARLPRARGAPPTASSGSCASMNPVFQRLAVVTVCEAEPPARICRSWRRDGQCATLRRPEKRLRIAHAFQKQHETSVTCITHHVVKSPIPRSDLVAGGDIAEAGSQYRARRPKCRSQRRCRYGASRLVTWRCRGDCRNLAVKAFGIRRRMRVRAAMSRSGRRGGRFFGEP